MAAALRPWVFRAELLRVVDADTLDLRLDLGFRIGFSVRVRLEGIDTPERRGPTRELGERASAFVERMLGGESRDPQLEVETLAEVDKYGGRWLGRVRLVGRDPGTWIDLGRYLVLLGYAQEWSGAGPRPTWDPAVPYPLLPGPG